MQEFDWEYVHICNPVMVPDKEIALLDNKEEI